MKKILLANIGNRNLNLDGKPLFQHFKPKENTVKAFSRDLLHNFEDVRDRLSVVIIDTLISKESDDLEEVILYGSDQNDEAVNDQDTIYVALILQKLLQEQYPESRFTVKPLEGISVVDNDALLKFYREELIKISTQSSELEFIVCDAGGTAQQKSALKIMAEFVLTSKKYRTYYQNIKSNTLELVEQVEYRKVITQEQVAVLVGQGEYSAALTLYTLTSPHDSLVRLLKLGAFRKEMLHESAISCINGSLMQLDPWVEGFKKRITNHEKESIWDELLGKKFLFALRERLDWTCYAFQLGNVTAAVLGFQVFTEYLVNVLLECRFPKFKNASEDKRVGSLLVRHIRENEPQLDDFFKSPIDRVSLPVLIKFCQTFAEEEVAELLADLERYNSLLNKINKINSMGIDELRNRIAHDGEGVTHEKLQRIAPNFNDQLRRFRRLLAMPSENGYNLLNEIIIRQLRYVV